MMFEEIKVEFDRFSSDVNNVLALHSIINSQYWNLKSMEEIYHGMYKLLGTLGASSDAFHFYAMNHFKGILFMLDQSHSLHTTLSDLTVKRNNFLLRLEQFVAKVKVFELQHDYFV